MMRLLSKTIGMTCLTLMFCTGLSTLALSTDRTVYDKPMYGPARSSEGM